MKLNLSYSEFCSIVDGSILSGPSNGVVHQISYDSRKSYSQKETVFFALQGNFRDGHNFISAAHENGISCFIISKSQDHFEHVQLSPIKEPQERKFDRTTFGLIVLILMRQALSGLRSLRI